MSPAKQRMRLKGGFYRDWPRPETQKTAKLPLCVMNFDVKTPEAVESVGSRGCGGVCWGVSWLLAWVYCFCHLPLLAKGVPTRRRCGIGGGD